MKMEDNFKKNKNRRRPTIVLKNYHDDLRKKINDDIGKKRGGNAMEDDLKKMENDNNKKCNLRRITPVIFQV
jgi:hypothetical protein